MHRIDVVFHRVQFGVWWGWKERVDGSDEKTSWPNWTSRLPTVRPRNRKPSSSERRERTTTSSEKRRQKNILYADRAAVSCASQKKTKKKHWWNRETKRDRERGRGRARGIRLKWNACRTVGTRKCYSIFLWIFVTEKELKLICPTLWSFLRVRQKKNICVLLNLDGSERQF